MSNYLYRQRSYFFPLQCSLCRCRRHRVGNWNKWSWREIETHTHRLFQNGYYKRKSVIFLANVYTALSPHIKPSLYTGGRAGDIHSYMCSYLHCWCFECTMTWVSRSAADFHKRRFSVTVFPHDSLETSWRQVKCKAFFLQQL